MRVRELDGTLLELGARLLRRFARRTASDEATPAEVLSGLQDPFRGALLSMYRNEPQIGLDGQSHGIDPSSRIPPSEGMWLYKQCCARRPRAILEIGTCYGYSSLFFLAALNKNGSGQLTSVDPHERTMWQGIALATVERLGLGGRFRHIEDRSDRAATDLAREGAAFDVVFIDGSHHFDDALVDFYMYAPLCAKGGIVIFDDMWMAGIRSAVSFVRTNRTDFREVETPERNISVFEKIGEDARAWDHFERFAVAAK